MPDDIEISTTDDNSGDEYLPVTHKRNTTDVGKANNKATTQLLTVDVASALDRNKTSDREAVRLLAPVAAALGYDPAELAISCNSFQRAWKRTRSELAK